MLLSLRIGTIYYIKFNALQIYRALWNPKAYFLIVIRSTSHALRIPCTSVLQLFSSAVNCPSAMFSYSIPSYMGRILHRGVPSNASSYVSKSTNTVYVQVCVPRRTILWNGTR